MKTIEELTDEIFGEIPKEKIEKTKKNLEYGYRRKK